MMETLGIEIPFDKQEFMDSQKIKWIFLWKDITRKIRVWLIAAVILMIAGLLASNDGEPFNVYLFIGSLFLLYTLLLWQSKWISKRTHIRQTKLLAERYENIGMDCKYEFTNESLRYWDAEKHFDLKWGVFKNYTFYKGYLVLLVGESLVDLLMFRIVETGEDEKTYHKVLAFVKKKLEYKKTE